MDSSNTLNIKTTNQIIVDTLIAKGAIDRDSAIFIEALNLDCSIKLQYYLIEEFIRNDFIGVLEDGKIFFKQKKYTFEKKKVQGIYFGILGFPFILALIMILI